MTQPSDTTIREAVRERYAAAAARARDGEFEHARAAELEQAVPFD